ncbi:hypothetical protein NMY22_g10280 [Coprinellus aureogranulatus]|nr:hypothetical protein NMY22_g10280 [Coprinellus aureogranulatus]
MRRINETILQLFVLCAKHPSRVVHNWRDLYEGGLYSLILRSLAHLTEEEADSESSDVLPDILKTSGAYTMYPCVLKRLIPEAKPGVVPKVRGAKFRDSVAEFGDGLGERVTLFQMMPPGFAICDNLHCNERQIGSPMMQCSRCHTVIYCSQLCQSQDWKRLHRYECDSARVDHAHRRSERLTYTHSSRTFHVRFVEQTFNAEYPSYQNEVASAYPSLGSNEWIPIIQTTQMELYVTHQPLVPLPQDHPDYTLDYDNKEIWWHRLALSQTWYFDQGYLKPRIEELVRGFRDGSLRESLLGSDSQGDVRVAEIVLHMSASLAVCLTVLLKRENPSARWEAGYGVASKKRFNWPPDVQLVLLPHLGWSYIFFGSCSHHDRLYIYTSLGSTTSALLKEMCEELGPQRHYDIQILEFAHHVWGLDRTIGRQILDMNIKLDARQLYSYRRSESADELCTPFNGFRTLLLTEVASRLNSSAELAMDHFWEKEGNTQVVTTFAEQQPLDGAEQDLRIAKHLLEFTHHRFKDSGSFLSGPRRAHLKQTFSSGLVSRRKLASTHPQQINSERRASPGPDSSESSSSTLSLTGKKRRRESNSSSDAPREAKRRRFDGGVHLLSFATACLAATSRLWVTGLLIDTCEVTACYFDRQLVACSSSFRFDQNPAILALVLYAMNTCTKERAGFNPNLVLSPLKASLREPGEKSCLPVPGIVGSFSDFTSYSKARRTLTEDNCHNAHPTSNRIEEANEEGGNWEGDSENNGAYDSEERPTIEQRQMRHRQIESMSSLESTCFRIAGFIHQPDHVLISRATTVYKVHRRLSSGMFDSKPSVLKFGWALKTRVSEIDTIKHLHSVLPKSSHDHLPKLFFSQSWTAEQIGLPWLDLKLSLSEDNHQCRVLRVLASGYYRKLWEAGSIENFKQAWLDCVEVCYLAFRMGKVLHRDISENNVMLLPLSDGAVKGVLNDWDMAKYVQGGCDGPTPGIYGTGTPPFMARDFLRGHQLRCQTTHYFRHDLKPLFYVLIWASIHYNLRQGTRDTEIHRVLAGWTKDVDCNMAAKTGFMTGGSQEENTVLDAVKPEFAQVAKEWIKPLRRLFKTAIFFGTEDEEDGSYDPSTYNGHLTFKKFMDAIKVPPRTWGIPNYLDDP